MAVLLQVFGGGPVLTANPEPYSDFLDVVLLGQTDDASVGGAICVALWQTKTGVTPALLSNALAWPASMHLCRGW